MGHCPCHEQNFRPENKFGSQKISVRKNFIPKKILCIENVVFEKLLCIKNVVYEKILDSKKFGGVILFFLCCIFMKDSG